MTARIIETNDTPLKKVEVEGVTADIIENALKNALVTFAVARTLNGVISAAQGTEVALEPGGVGVVLSVGEVLDPINDLIERFSAVIRKL